MFWIFLVYAAFLGMVLGSFLGLAAIRLRVGESLVRPRSHCRNCDAKLSWYENIPLLSYLFLKGRCGHCSKPISPRYFLMELSATCLAILTYWEIHPWPRALLYFCLLVAPVLLLIFMDAEWFVLPDAVTVPGIILGIAVHILDTLLWPGLHPVAWWHPALDSVLGILAGGLTLLLLAQAYALARKKEGMGGGDVKMAAMLGAFFGWKAVFFIFFLSSLLGIVFGVVLILRRRAASSAPIPFGSCLGASALLYLYWGEILIRKYLAWAHSVL